MTTSTIYLVVTESDKTSITWASFDQFKAQQMCHRIAEKTGIAHAVVAEKRYNIPMSVMLELKKQFNLN